MVKIRRGLLIFVLVNLFIVGTLVHSVFTLITLLFEDGAADAIPRADIPAPNSDLIESMPRNIPKIIHQTYKNETIPEMWREAKQSCLDLHKDYEYKLWTDEKSEKFIADEYPWFLDTFMNYPNPIQRADAIRYFVLAHFGGIYIDLDDGCHRRLDPLLSYRAWVRRTIPTGISNDVMGAVPRHPFFLLTIELLQHYDRSWLLPYITVMGSTGPLFFSVIWKKYMNTNPSEANRVRILMPTEYNGMDWSFFTHNKGSSWHGKDARLIFWMGRHWLLLTTLGFLAAGIVFGILWWAYKSFILTKVHYKGGSRSPIHRRLPRHIRRLFGGSFGLPGKPDYELVEDRHEV